MTMARQRKARFLTTLVEAIADYRGVDPDHPDFCLYEATDPEALERLIESTDGPLTTEFQIDDASVTVRKTVDDGIDIEVTATEALPHPSD